MKKIPINYLNRQTDPPKRIRYKGDFYACPKTAARTKPAEESPKKQPFLKRLLFGEERLDLMDLEAGSTTILDILSPTTVDTKSRDYIVVDGVFHAYLYNLADPDEQSLVSLLAARAVSFPESPVGG